MVYGETTKHINPFFLLLKLPQTGKKKDWFCIFFFWLVTIGFFIVVDWESIGEQEGETMGSTPINENRMVPGGFLLGSHLTSFIFIFYYIRFSLEY